MADVTAYQLMQLVAAKTRRTGFTACLERTNPLHGLSLRDAQAIYDSARMGNYTRLQYIYHEIERTDPVLMTCVERRSAALAGLGWKVGASAAANDPALADAQKDAVTKLAESLFNLDETVEHLALAFFRGFSHARVIRDERGVPTGFDLLENYNFAYDNKARQWWWNPNCIFGEPGDPGMIPVPNGELVSVVRPRAIDYPALSIYIRHALAEKSWGRFLERYGIPPVNVTMPENATEKDLDMFLKGAAKLNDGDNGAWPAGTSISYAGEARGVNPFTDFIAHQEKLIVLLATGGTLTSLAEAGSGTLAGNAQMDVWEQIVSRDAVIIGAALNREVFRPYLKAMFPGQPIVATFELGKEMEAAPTEVFDIGAKAKAAGYTIAQEDLEEASGYTLVKDETPAAQPGGLGFNSAAPVENAAPVAPKDEPEETEDESDDDDPMDTLKAFAASRRPGADAFARFVENPTEEAAEDLMEHLEELVNDGPLESILAEAMTKAMAGTLKADAVANAGTSEGARKGWETRRRNGWSEELIEEKGAELKELAEEVFAGSKEEKEISIGAADGDEAKDIKDLLGIDVTGQDHIVRADDMRHAYHRHGPEHRKGRKRAGEKNPDQIPLTPDDFQKLPEVYSSYTDIKRGDPDRHTGNPTVIYQKKYDDGTLIAVEVVPEDGALSYKTGYKWKPGYEGRKKSAESPDT